MNIPEIEAQEMTREAYAPFGALIRAEVGAAREANHGRAEAWDDLAALVNERPDARPSVSVFRCAPLDGPVLEVRWLERHPRSTQLFVPMHDARYLVVVAQGEEAPDRSSLRAFVVRGPAAITYAPGVWHHPMVALDRPTDFVNLLFVDGGEQDCEERSFDPPLFAVRLGTG